MQCNTITLFVSDNNQFSIVHEILNNIPNGGAGYPGEKNSTIYIKFINYKIIHCYQRVIHHNDDQKGLLLRNDLDDDHVDILK